MAAGTPRRLPARCSSRISHSPSTTVPPNGVTDVRQSPDVHRAQSTRGTGSLGPLYRWMVRYFGPEVWSALGTWFTAAVAIATVLVAGRYAKQQVEKAQDQVDEARRTRELQAQPNVVLYSEPNPSVWQILEVVVKNFGTTPAYDIKISITPQLQATPNHVTYPEIADIPVPRRLHYFGAWSSMENRLGFGTTTCVS